MVSIVGVSFEIIVERQTGPVSTPDRPEIIPRSTAIRTQIEAYVNFLNLVYRKVAEISAIKYSENEKK